MALVFNVQKGTYTLSGVNTALAPYRLHPITGTFAVSPVAPYLAGPIQMVASTGAFVLTGQNAALATPADGVERTVDVSLRFPTPVTSASIKFLPDLSAGDGLVVLEKYYTLTLVSDSPTNILSGSIALPTLSTRSIPYRVQFPKETGVNEHYIYLSAGTGAIELSSLLNLASAVDGTIDLNDLNDVTITAAASGEYLRYNGTEWADSAIQVGDLPASVMLKTTYDTDTDGVVDKTAQVVMTARNDTATTLTVGEVVYVSGASGEHVKVKRALADSDANSAGTIGMVVESIASGADGKIALHGVVTSVNTNAFNEGDDLWLSDSIAGGLTSTRPNAPSHGVFIGWVTKKSSNGKIALHIQNGYELEELHDVLLTDLADGEFLVYDADTELWNNQSKADLDIASDSEVVKVTGAQSIAGAKTFTDNVVVSRANGQVIFETPTTQPTSSDMIGTIGFRAFNDFFNAQIEGARIRAMCDGTPGVGIPTSILFQTANTGSAPLDRMTLQKTGNLTIGTTTDYSRRLVSASTTAQARLMYDASNYYDISVGSNGNTTFSATGSGARFTFSSPVTLNSVIFAQKFKAVVSPNISYDSDGDTLEITPVPNSYGVCTVTVDNDDITFLAPSGTFDDGQKLLIRIVASVTTSLTFNAAYKAGTVELPIETVSGKTQYLGFFYSTYSSKWELVGYTEV